MTVKPKPYTSAASYNISALRFDLREDGTSLKPRLTQQQQPSTQRKPHKISIELDGPRPETNSGHQPCLAETDYRESIEEVREDIERIRGYNELLDTYRYIVLSF